MGGMSDPLFLRACRRQPVERTPCWMMRQAGRYLPAYQATRKRAGGFLDLCKTPTLACEVTLQPIDEFGFDAAILFSDILIPLEAMGLPVEFGEHGPTLPTKVEARADVERLAIPDPALAMPFVLDAVRAIRKGLAGRVPLIGFAGAPFTMACYAVEGGGSKSYEKTKRMMFAEPATFHALLEKIAATTVAYLEAQVEAGAQAVQLFDSWAGVLAPPDYRDVALRWVTEVIARLRASAIVQRAGAPIIYFVNGIAPYLDDVAEAGADVYGIDWRVDLAEVRRRLGPGVAVQGNLDNTALFLPPDRLRARVGEVLKAAGDAPGHIFNLGHGVLPPTDPEHVRVMVEAVRELSRRA
jgi:uroporphyrinogen decarboxylase